jgi:hypothetical protein
VKKVALAGFLLVLLALGVAYNRMHDSASSGVGAAGATGISWVTMRDTREKAFSIQVPQGWKTYGGLFRFSTIDARMIVDMTSPDGLTNLRVGDSMVPPYRVPGPFLLPGPGVAAYAAGNVFATKYGQARFYVPGAAIDEKRCAGAKVSSRGRRDHADYGRRGVL